jgi:hypothetical protein
VVQTATGELQRCLDVRQLQIGQLLNHLLGTEPRGQKIQNISNPDAHATDTGPTSANAGIHGDAVHQVGHGLTNLGEVHGVSDTQLRVAQASETDRTRLFGSHSGASYIL